MANKEITPDSLMLRQADGQWQKFCGLLLWKLVGRDKAVTITAADIEACHKAFEPGAMTVLIHGHYDSIDFKLISERDAHRAAIEDARKGGHA
jgi:hypothetical protein